MKTIMTYNNFKNNKLVLYTGGTYDIFHFGHVNFLKKCSKISDKVVVALNTDEFIHKFKGAPPIMNFEERKRSLLECQYVDEVVPNLCGQDSKPTILEVNPNIIAVGSDWASKNYYKQMSFTEEWLEENDIILVYLSYTEMISTTEIKNRIKEL